MTLRSLVLAKDTAWPGDTGYRQRLQAVVRGLAAAGVVDHVTVCVPGTVLPEPPAGLLRRAGSVEAGWYPRRVAAARWAATPGAPHWVTGRDWRSARRGLPRVLTGDYDLVWCSQADLWAGLRDALPAPELVVDLDNLMSAVVARDQGGGALRRAVRREEVRRWRSVERALLREAAAVAVCSELDAARLRPGDRLDRRVVLSNGAAGSATARPPGDRRPVLLLVASLDYPPNSEAALWCAREVLPLVRAQVPGAVLRVVGRDGAATPALRGLPGVEVVGRVDDVAEELARAAVSVAPLQQGGGTRIKVLEAFGAGLATVSTTVGAEGIPARHGEHLLLADGAQDFAAACVRLLTDPAEAGRLGAAARSLHAERFEWSQVERVVAQLARRLVDRAP